MNRTPILLALALFAAALTAPPARAGDFTVGLSLSLNVGRVVYIPVTVQDYLNGELFSRSDYLVGVADAYRHILTRGPSDDPRRKTFERTRLDLAQVVSKLGSILECSKTYPAKSALPVTPKAPVAPLFLDFLRRWDVMEHAAPSKPHSSPDPCVEIFILVR